MIHNCSAQRTEYMLQPTPGISTASAQVASNPSLRTLFDTEESALLRYAFSLTGRRAIAEEIVQEAFLQLHSRWDEIEAPKAWLFRCVRNRAYNYVRDHQREILSSDDEYADAAKDEDTTPEAVIQRLEANATLRQLLDELDETDRLLVKLKYFEGLKYRDISARTGLTVSNVGYRLHHILKQLAGKLRPLGIDEMS